MYLGERGGKEKNFLRLRDLSCLSLYACNLQNRVRKHGTSVSFTVYLFTLASGRNERTLRSLPKFKTNRSFQDVFKLRWAVGYHCTR